MSSYPGGKSGAGVYQTLINQIPEHDYYVAGFSGHDAIAKFKRPAKHNVLIDRDRRPLDWWAKYLADNDADLSSWSLINDNCINWLSSLFGLNDILLESGPTSRSTVDGNVGTARWFANFDPPYLMSTRSSGKIYQFEMQTSQHVEFLKFATRLPCNVMICHYPSDLYEQHLQDWRRIEYYSVARNGEKRVEHCWMNYDSPVRLHDSQYVGGDKRHRENVRRRIRRLTAKLEKLTPHERQAVLDSLPAGHADDSDHSGSGHARIAGGSRMPAESRNMAIEQSRQLSLFEDQAQSRRAPSSRSEITP